VIQKDRITPVATMVAVKTDTAPSRIVVRRRPGLASRLTRTLPPMPARAKNAAITPDSQMAFSPYSSRKYGCHAYHAHAKNPQVRKDSMTSRRTAGFCHP